MVAEHTQLRQGRQYKDVIIEDRDAFNRRLEHLPFFTLNDLHPDWPERRRVFRGTLDVPIDEIIGRFSTDESWLFDHDRGESYIHDLALAIRDGTAFCYQPDGPIHLVKWGKDFFIGNNGRHRCAAVKGMLSQHSLSVPADVAEYEL
ncbi:MAG: hypothetical protein QY326_05180 [Bdellovibrionota bacterium]|nr:MAG: hypothetical protein QY326_05180 [Bdellovibrionota bacterium]